MQTIQEIALLMMIFIGIPLRIIDYKHRRKNAYQSGNAWGYYAELSKKGNWEGRFMMWSAYLVITFVFVVIGYTFYALTR